MPVTTKVSPFLWFDGQAEAAARFYVSVFPNSRLISVTSLEAGPAEGAAIAEFEIEGLKFTALDGGPMYTITPAISFVVSCDTQDEIDYYWDALTDGGRAGPVRLAARQVRSLMAGGARRAWRTHAAQPFVSHRGIPHDGEARSGATSRGGRRVASGRRHVRVLSPSDVALCNRGQHSSSYALACVEATSL